MSGWLHTEMAGKVTIDLTLYWQCITDISRLNICGLKTCEGKISSTQPMLQWSMARPHVGPGALSRWVSV